MKLSLIMSAIRTAFAVGGRIAPRFAARKAFTLFCTPPPARALSDRAQSLMQRAERVTLQVNGTSVRLYRWAPGESTSRGRVLLAHGWGSRAARFRPWVETLSARGYEVWALDAPAHGESGGRRTTLPEYVAAIRASGAQHGPFDALVGHSFGGMAAAFATSARSPLAGEALQVKAMVLVAPPDRVSDVIRHFASAVALPDSALPHVDALVEAVAGAPLDRFSAARVQCDSRIATLLLHDREDDEVDFSASTRIARASGARLHESSGLGHHQVLTAPEQVQRGIAFIDEHVLAASRLATAPQEAGGLRAGAGL